MFEGFANRGADRPGRRLAPFVLLSTALYGGGALAFAFAGHREPMPPPPVEVDVVIKAPPPPVKQAPPPPPLPVFAPPPAPDAPKPRPNPQPKPKPKPAAPLVAPKEVPQEAPPEADPVPEAPASDAADTGEISDAYGDVPAAPPVIEPPPPPPPPKKKAPVNLPEDAEPPVPHDRNTPPQMPEEARQRGIEGTVILKLVISDTGAVERIEMLRGDELLARAAIQAVRTWRYSPARLDGEPIATFKIVKLTFRLK